MLKCPFDKTITGVRHGFGVIYFSMVIIYGKIQHVELIVFMALIFCCQSKIKAPV